MDDHTGGRDTPHVPSGAGRPQLHPGGHFVQKGHRVISDPSFCDKGLEKDQAFARLRHLLYGGSILFYLSLVISTTSLAAFSVRFAIALIAAYKERLLVERQGDEYREYQPKVPRWVPRLRPARFK